MSEQKAANKKTTMREELRAFKRERVLDAASELFYARGYHSTSIDAIAAQLGVSKPFIYSYFNNKIEILTEIYRRVVALAQQTITDARSSGGSPTEQITHFAEGYARLTIEKREIVSIYFQETNQIPSDDLKAINQQKHDYDNQLSSLIKEGIQSGEFNLNDEHMAALAITGMINWVYTWYRENGRLTPDQVSQRMVDYTLRILGANPQ